MRRELTKSARRGGEGGKGGERLHPNLTFALVPENLF